MEKKILVIDDEGDIVEEMQVLLQSKDFLVDVATDGQSGLEKVKTFKPDLIILDIMMPKMDGWEVLKKLRDNEATRLLPVIMLTAIGDTSSLFKSETHWATDYFIKPFEAAELLRFIKRYI